MKSLKFVVLEKLSGASVIVGVCLTNNGVLQELKEHPKNLISSFIRFLYVSSGTEMIQS